MLQYLPHNENHPPTCLPSSLSLSLCIVEHELGEERFPSSASSSSFPSSPSPLPASLFFPPLIHYFSSNIKPNKKKKRYRVGVQKSIRGYRQLLPDKSKKKKKKSSWSIRNAHQQHYLYLHDYVLRRDKIELKMVHVLLG